MENVYELFVEQLQDIYNAEQQLVKALPKMAEGSTTPELQRAFTAHLTETEGHVERLETIATELDEDLTGKKCKAMEGLVTEGAEALDEEGDENVLDIGLVVAAQRVEHYEIAAYGNAVMLAEKLGFSKVTKLLKQTLTEEEKADALLTTITQQNILPNCPLNDGDSSPQSANL